MPIDVRCPLVISLALGLLPRAARVASRLARCTLAVGTAGALCARALVASRLRHRFDVFAARFIRANVHAYTVAPPVLLLLLRDDVVGKHPSAVAVCFENNTTTGCECVCAYDNPQIGCNLVQVWQVPYENGERCRSGGDEGECRIWSGVGLECSNIPGMWYSETQPTWQWGWQKCLRPLQRTQ